jgi:toxin ParE1/3/4
LTRIRWTEPAARDLTHICDYTEQRDGPAAARRIALRIHGAIEQLATFPESGRIGRKPGPRELIFRGLPFLALYRLRPDAVEIARILHGA